MNSSSQKTVLGKRRGRNTANEHAPGLVKMLCFRRDDGNREFVTQRYSPEKKLISSESKYENTAENMTYSRSMRLTFGASNMCFRGTELNNNLITDLTLTLTKVMSYYIFNLTKKSYTVIGQNPPASCNYEGIIQLLWSRKPVSPNESFLHFKVISCEKASYPSATVSGGYTAYADIQSNLRESEGNFDPCMNPVKLLEKIISNYATVLLKGFEEEETSFTESELTRDSAPDVFFRSIA